MPASPTDFDSWYRDDPDPFAVRSSPYEQRKLAVVLASLAAPRYALAWDAACGTGDLAVTLAARADRVVATDAAARAVELTRALADDGPDGVRVATAVCALPGTPTPGTSTPGTSTHETGDVEVHDADLVVLSEVCYYLSREDRLATYAMVDAVAAPDAECVAVTWRNLPGDAHVSGDEATREITAWFTARGWRAAVRHVDTDFTGVHLVRGRAGTPRPGAAGTAGGDTTTAPGDAPAASVTPGQGC